MSQTFDRFRASFELNNDQENNENIIENYEKELVEFTEAAKKLIKEKVKPKEMQNKQRIIDLLQLCASDAFGKESGDKKPIIDVNVTNIKSDSIDDKSSLIVSVEMSSENVSCPKSGSKKRSRRAAKKCGKKSQMTITAMLGQSVAGMSQQVTITKDKSGSFSISGVSIQKNDNLSMGNRSSSKKKVTKNRTKTENVSETVTETEGEITLYNCKLN